MPKTLPAKDVEEIEKLMDAHGLRSFVGGVALVCALKSTHASDNWQDQKLARRWERIAVRLEKLSESIDDPYEG